MRLEKGQDLGLPTFCQAESIVHYATALSWRPVEKGWASFNPPNNYPLISADPLDDLHPSKPN
jgi:hypothetical protein